MADIERLTQLRRVIEAAPDDRLHMNHYCERSTCGTAYCAAGWAAVDPWFQAHTPILKTFMLEPGYDGTGPIVTPLDWAGPTVHDLKEIFGISMQDAELLFGFNVDKRPLDPHVVTKAEVLANIDRLLTGRQAEQYAAYREANP